MITALPSPVAPDFGAVRARRRAEAVRLLRRPGHYLDVSGAAPTIASAMPERTPPAPRPVASGIKLPANHSWPPRR